MPPEIKKHKTRFGLNQRNNPTPKKVEARLEFAVKALGVVAGYLVIADWVPAQVSNILSPIISSLLMPLLLEAKKLWGVEIDKRYVPTDQVEVIDEEAKKD